MMILLHTLGHMGWSVAVAFAVVFVLKSYSSSSMWIWSIDYRLVMLGALLPDWLDKPLALWLAFPGRTFGHTLLFGVFLLVVSLIIYEFTGSRGFLVLSLASAGHLLMDRMWEAPQTLFWPLYGLSFGGAEHDLSPDWLRWVQTGTGRALLGGLGALVLVLFAFRLCVRGSVLKWLRTGVG